MQILGVDFGLKTFAACSDGETFTVSPSFTFDKAAKVLSALCAHAAKYDRVIVEGLKGQDNTAKNILWFKKSMRRRFPRVKVIRADHNYPSSKFCSNCKSLNTEFVGRILECADCGYAEDRDINAAKNLRDWPSSPEFPSHTIDKL